MKIFFRHGVLLHPHHNWFVSLAHTSIEVEKIKFSVQEFSCSGGTVSCCNSESYDGGEKGALWIKWEKYKVINEKPKSSSIFPTYMFKRTFCLISDTFRLIWYILVKSFCANRMKLRLTASNEEGKGERGVLTRCMDSSDQFHQQTYK